MWNLLFRGPWYAKGIIAVILAGLAYALVAAHAHSEAEKAQAREMGVPAAVSLNDFDAGRDIHAHDEVHVTGWLNPEYNYQLTQNTRRKLSTTTTVKRMFVMFGPEDGTESRQVRAIVMLSPSEVDGFLDGLTASVRGIAPVGFMFDLNGAAATTTGLSDMVDDALAEQGLTKAPGFRYIEPWGARRDEVLAASDGAFLNDLVYGLLVASGFFVLLALVAFKGRHKRAAQMAALKAQAGAMAAQKAAVTAAKAAPQPGPWVGAADAAAVAAQVPKGGMPRWLLPAFLLVAVIALGATVGGWAATGMILIGLVVFGAVQAQRAASRGLAAGFAMITAKGKAPEAARDDGPITTTQGLGASVMAAVTDPTPINQRKGLGRYAPLAIGVVILFAGNSLFKDVNPMLAGLGLSPNGVGAEVAVAVTAAEPAPPVQAPLVTAKEEPVAQTEVLAPAEVAPLVADMPVAAAADAPAAAVGAQRADWQLVTAGLLLLFVSVALVLLMPPLRRRLAERSAEPSVEVWARLDRIVARERALGAGHPAT